jgi:hypothetical protein
MKILRSQFVAVAGAAWLLAAAVIALAAPQAPPQALGDARPSLLAGWAMAGLTGAMSFGLLAYADGRPLKVFLTSVFGGFLARLVLVALGLVWAIHRGYSPIWFCVSFFALYWLFFACEVLAFRQVLRRRSGPELLATGAVT